MDTNPFYHRLTNPNLQFINRLWYLRPSLLQPHIILYIKHDKLATHSVNEPYHHSEAKNPRISLLFRAIYSHISAFKSLYAPAIPGSLNISMIQNRTVRAFLQKYAELRLQRIYMTAPYLQEAHYAIDRYLESLYKENNQFKCQVMSQMKDNGDVELVLGTRSHFKDSSSLIYGAYKGLIQHLGIKYPIKHKSSLIENGNILVTETSFPTQCLNLSLHQREDPSFCYIIMTVQGVTVLIREMQNPQMVDLHPFIRVKESSPRAKFLVDCLLFWSEVNRSAEEKKVVFAADMFKLMVDEYFNEVDINDPGEEGDNINNVDTGLGLGNVGEDLDGSLILGFFEFYSRDKGNLLSIIKGIGSDIDKGNLEYFSPVTAEEIEQAEQGSLVVHYERLLNLMKKSCALLKEGKTQEALRWVK